MISKLSGKLKQKRSGSVLIDVNGICYEVFLPGVVRKKVDGTINIEENITLITYHYMQSDPSRSIPILIGFLNEIEREFFEKFITVSGVGPKAAVKALSEPISSIIQAIEAGDITRLRRLPGIGEQRAKQIVAKLQGKVGRFGLIQDAFEPEQLKLRKNIEEEAIEILSQLQYKTAEAEKMIKDALDKDAGIKTTEDLLNEVYKRRHGGK